ncbi:MAG: septum formation initiator family protein [Patescibacteria group bacterium]|nr:septum formation initiator family protein [Patescibacteria group bacterium]
MFFNPRSAIGLATIITIFMMFSGLVEKLHKSKLADKYIENLESEIATLDKQNQDLEKLIEYMETDAFAEKKAKEILRRQKDGEIVVSLPGSERVEYRGTKAQEIDLRTLPNPQQWYYYFFGQQ